MALGSSGEEDVEEAGAGKVNEGQNNCHCNCPEERCQRSFARRMDKLCKAVV